MLDVNPVIVLSIFLIKTKGDQYAPQ